MATSKVSIRIEEEMLRKFSYVVGCEQQSINSQILMLINKSIQEYENIHGVIGDVIPPDINVKVAKKGAKSPPL